MDALFPRLRRPVLDGRSGRLLLPCALFLLVLGSESAEAQLEFTANGGTRAHYVFEGESASYSVRPTSRPANSVTVSITGHAGTDLSLSKTSLTFTPSNWETPQEVIISAAEDNDSSDENNIPLAHTYTGGTSTLFATILDVDAHPRLIALPTHLTVPEGGQGSFGLRMNAPIGDTRSFEVNRRNPAFTSSDHLSFNPTRIEFAPSNWNKVQSITVTVAEDDDTDNERFWVSTDQIGGGNNAGVWITIADNDGTQPGLLVPTSIQVAEGSTANYGVRLATQPSSAVTVEITGTAGTDLTLDSTSLTFNPTGTNLWSTPQTVTITAGRDDNVANDLARLRHTASGGGYAGQTADLLVTTIETPNSITLSVDADTDLNGTQTSLAEDGGRKTVRVTATIDGTTRFLAATDVNIVVGKATDNAAEGTDYATVADRTITIPRGMASGTVDFPITPTDDNTDEGDETISIEGELTGVTITPTSVTITDDETPTLSIADASAREGQDLSFTLTRSGDLSAGSSVTYTTGDDTTQSAAKAAAGTDYTAVTTATTVSFAATETTKTVTVASLADALVEGDETFRVNLSAPSGASLAGAFATGTITEGTSGYSVADASADEGDNLSFTVTRSGFTGAASSVSWSTADDTADGAHQATATGAARDYTPQDTAAALAFDAGDTSKTIAVATRQDTADEPEETFRVALSAPGATGALVRGTATGTITDDDATTVTLTVPDARAEEGSGTDTAELTLTLNRGLVAGESLGVPLAFAGGVAGTDFTLALAAPAPAGVTLSGSTVTFTGRAGGSAGAASLTLTASNDADTTDDTVTVSIPAASTGDAPVLAAAGLGGGATGSRTGAGVITLIDSADGAVTVAETGAGTEVTEAAGDGNTDTYTLALAAAPRHDVTVTVTAPAGLLVDGPDAAAAGAAGEALTFTARNWSAPQTVTVFGVDDDIDQGASRTLAIGHAAASDDDRYDEIGIADVEVTVADDDARGVSADPATVTVRETDDAATADDTENVAAYEVVLDSQPTAEVTVTITNPPDSPVTLDRTTLTFTTSNWDDPQEVEVTAVDDAVDNAGGRRTATLSHDVGGGDYGQPEDFDVAVTVTDDEATPVATLALTPDAIAESGAGNVSTVTATLSHASAAAVTLTVAVPNGSPVTRSGSALTIAAGSTGSTGAVTLTAVDNSADAPNATVAVSATASGGGVADPADATLTITDDDATTVTLTVPDARAEEGSGTDTAELTLTLNRGLVAGESLGVPLAFAGGVAGTDFTLALAAPAPAGVTLSGSTVTFTGRAGGSAGAASLTLTASNDADTTDDTVTVSIPAASTGDAPVLAAAGLGGGATGSRTGAGVITLIDSADGAVTVAETGAGTEVTEAAGDGNTDTYTLALAAAPRHDVTVTVTAPAGLLVDGPDAAAAGAAGEALTFTARNWSAPQTVTVFGVDDDIDQGASRTLAIGHAAASDDDRYDEIGIADVEVTVADDDARGVSADPATVTVRETDDAATADDTENVAAYEVVLDSQPTAEVTVTITNPPDSPVTLDRTTLTFTTSNWDDPQEVEVTAVDDAVDNAGGRRTATLSHDVGGGDYGQPEDFDVAVTVTDDEATPVATLALTPDAIAESGAGNVSTVTATLSHASAAAVTLTVAVPNGSPVTRSGSALTIAAGSTGSTGAVTLTAVDNSADAPNATVAVSATASGGGVADPADATLTITDDDATTVTLTVPDARAEEGSGTDTAELTLTLNRGLVAGESLGVPLAFAGGVAGTDFTLALAAPAPAGVTLSGSTVTFTGRAGGSAGAASLTLTASNDADTTDDTVTVSIPAASTGDAPVLAAAGLGGGATGSRTGAGVITLIDSADGAVTVAETGAGTEVTEAAGDGNTDTYTLALAAAPRHDVTVTVTAPAGLLVDGPDAAAAGAAGEALTFTARNWSAPQTVTVFGVDDDIDQGASRTLAIGHAAASDDDRYDEIGIADVEVTVADDDARGVSADPATVTVRETDDAATADDTENVAAYEVVLDSQPTAEVTVTITNPPDSPVTLDRTTLTFTTSNWDDPQEVEVTAVDDAVDNAGGRRTATLSHDVGGGDYGQPEDFDVAVTVTDDEATPVATLALTPDAIAESGAGNVSTVTATLSHASAAAVTLTVAVPNGSPVTRSGSALTIAAGSTGSTGAVTLTAVDNSADAPNATVAVSATASGGGVADPADATLTITDDDATTVTLTVPDARAEEGSGTDTAELTLTLNRGLVAGESLGVPLAFAGGVAGTDFTLALAAPAPAGVTLSGSTVTFTGRAGGSAGAASLTLTASNDADTTDDTVTVSIPAASTGDAPVLAAAGLGGGATGSRTGAGVITLIDSADGAVTVAETGAGTEVTEAAGDGNTDTYTLALAAAPRHDVTVTVTAPAGLLVDGPDAAAAGAAGEALTFTARNWSAPQTVTVFGVDDDIDQGASRTLAIGHAAASDDDRYDEIGIADVEVTVADDDARGVSADPATVTVRETDDAATADDTENVAAYEVVLDSQPTAEVTVTITNPPDSPVTLDRTTLTFTTSNWDDPQEVEVTAVDDAVDNAGGRRTATLSHDVGGGDYGQPEDFDVAVTVTDDDAAPTAITLSVDADTDTNGVQDSIAENGGVKRVRVTARITSATRFSADSEVTVAVGKSADSATEGVDYATVGDQTITIPAGAASAHADFTLTPTDDDTAEDSETISIEGELAGVTFANTAVTLTDDDEPADEGDPTTPGDIYLVAVPASLHEDAPPDGILTIEAFVRGSETFDTDTAVTVSFGQAGDSAVSGTDYQPEPDLVIVIPAGESLWAESICPRLIDDSLVEGDETFSILGRAGDLRVDGAEVTIIDDESREPTSVTLSVDPTSVAEGSEAAQITVTATADGKDTFLTDRTVTVAVGGADDTATEGGDYEAVADFTVTIAARAASGSATFTLTPIEDTDFEEAETIGVGGELSGVTVNAASIELTDNDEPNVALTITVDMDMDKDGVQSSIAEGDGKTRIQVTASLNGGERFRTDQEMMVTVGVEDDSAAEGNDYMEVADFPIPVASGAASGTGAFTLTPVDDAMAEGAETITVDGRLAGASIESARLTLMDNDDPPEGIALAANPPSVAEDGGQTAVTVTATVSGSTTYAGDTEVTVSIDSGTAIAGEDFSPVEDFGITIAGGERSGSAHFALSPIDDGDSEGDETVAITGAAGDIEVTATAVTIGDDERSVVLSASEVAVDEGASASWNVKLSAVPDGPVVLTISGQEGTDLSVDPVRLEFDETNWNSARTVTATAGEDDDTTDDSATLAHAASGGGYDSASASLRVDTADNDTTAIVLRPDSLIVVEGRGKSYEVTLGTEPSGDVAVAIGGHAGTRLRLDKSNLVFTASDWNAPQTVTVTAEDDGTDAGPQRDFATLTHAGAGGGYDGVGAELGIEVLLDPIVMAIDDAEGPEGSYLEFRVHLSKPSPGDVEANWGTHAEVARSARDFEPGEGRLHFADGEREKVISVWAEEDDVDDPNEIFTVDLWNPAGAVFDDPVTAVPGTHAHDLTVGVPVEVMRATGTIVGPAPDPLELSIGTSDLFVDEGGTTRVTVTATASNELERPVRVPLVYSNGTAEDGDFEGEPGLWIQSGRSEGSVHIAAVHDEDSDDETFTVSIGELKPLEAVAGDDDSVELTVLDDDGGDGDVEGLSVSVEDATAEEGKENLRFAVWLSRPADTPVTVWAATRAGTASEDRDYIHGSGEVRFKPGQRTRTFTVWVLDDDIDEGHETLTLQLSDPDPPEVAIGRATAAGTIKNSDPIPGAWLARFGRTLAQQTVDTVADRVQARREPGFEGSAPMLGLRHGPGGRGAPAGSTEGPGGEGPEAGGDAEPTADRNRPVQPGTMGGSGSTVGSGPAGAAAMTDGLAPVGGAYPCGAAPGVSTGMGPIAVHSPRAGAASADRMDPPGAATVSYPATGAGATAGFGQLGHGPAGGCGESPSAGEFLLQALSGASFTRTGEADPGGGTLAWWGRGEHARFSGGDGDLGLGGEVATGRLGVDYARGGWLVGVALAHSAGKGDWSGGVGVGELEASLTSLSPYAAFSISDRLQVWSTVGAGRGTLQLAHGTGDEWTEQLETDLQWRMAAAGARGDLFAAPDGAGPALSAVGDALWTDTSSGRTGGLVASRSAATRLRVGLEGSWAVPLNEEARLTPKLEVGARHDGGDAETGFGVDLGGGIEWSDPKRGISLDISGRTLIAHEDEGARDRGVSASFAWNANPDPERGLSLKLGQDLGGRSSGGLAALFAPDPPGQGFGTNGGARSTSELAYGLPVFDEAFVATPRLTYGISDESREYSFGWSLKPTRHGPDWSLDILSTWREDGRAAPEHGFRLEVEARW